MSGDCLSYVYNLYTPLVTEDVVTGDLLGERTRIKYK